MNSERVVDDHYGRAGDEKDLCKNGSEIVD